MTVSHRAYVACVIVSIILLTACVYTGAKYTTNPDVAGYAAKVSKNPDDIIVGENAIAGRHYKVIGSIEAHGRSLNLLSPAPTREDLDKALRVEAAKRGADAVINIEYKTHREGLASQGEMSATGQAVVFAD
jgi:uncharacterized protein YbjQ (UPF0145 family)